MRLRIVMLAALVAATPGYAADVAGLMKTVPVFSKVTGKNMYELERCMIEVDGPIMPHVYRQPDRPQRVMMVWDGGGGVGGRQCGGPDRWDRGCKGDVLGQGKGAAPDQALHGTRL